MSRSKTLKLFLMDGEPSGRIKCSLANWTGIAYKIPRTSLEKCKDMDILKRPSYLVILHREMFLLYHYYQPLPVEVAGFERILTCSRERAKTVDLFPRTELSHKNYALFPCTENQYKKHPTSI